MPEGLSDQIQRIADALLKNVWLIFVLFGLLGSLGKKKPKTAVPEPNKARPAREPSHEPSTFASDDRKPRDSMRFGSDDLFADSSSSEWGKTKFGFDDGEWGSSFGEKKSSEPVIYTGKD